MGDIQEAGGPRGEGIGMEVDGRGYLPFYDPRSRGEARGSLGEKLGATTKGTWKEQRGCINDVNRRDDGLPQDDITGLIDKNDGHFQPTSKNIRRPPPTSFDPPNPVTSYSPITTATAPTSQPRPLRTMTPVTMSASFPAT